MEKEVKPIEALNAIFEFCGNVNANRQTHNDVYKLFKIVEKALETKDKKNEKP